MITFTKLREQLEVSQPVLSRLVRDGMPHVSAGKRKLFDEAAVAEWLVENGLATVVESPGSGLVATTRDDVAKHFGVHVRTVAEWQTDETFPGRPGTRNLRDGCYPLDAIRDWLAKRDALRDGGPQVTTAREEFYALKLERSRYEFEEYKGSLTTVEEVKLEHERQIHVVKKILESMPDKAAKALPASTPASVRAKIVKRWKACVFEVERTLAEAIASDD